MIKAKKSIGQNFLIDHDVIDKITNIVLKNAAKKQGIVPKKQQKELLKKAKARFVDRNYLKGK